MKQKLLRLRNYSLLEVERLFDAGHLDASVFEAFCRVWEWSAPRFSGAGTHQQEVFFARYGLEAYYRKINKTRAAFGLAPLKG